MFFNKKIWLFLLTCIFCSSFSIAQNARYTEEEVNIEKRFIEAKREMLLRNYDKAINLFESVAEKERNNPAPYYELAKLYDLQEKPDLAKKNIQKAIELDPDNEWFSVFWANWLEKNKQDLEAAKVYEQLVQAHPQQEDFYHQWAYFLVRAEKPEEAIRVFEKLEQRVGLTAEITRRKHLIYHRMGKKKQAAKVLADLVDAYPSNLEYQHQLAAYFLEAGSEKNAEVVYRQILQQNPEDARASIALASLSTQKATADEKYLADLQQIIADEDVLVDVKVAKLYPFVEQIAREKDPSIRQQLLHIGQSFTEANPTAAKAYAMYADMLYQTNDLPAALEQYLASLKEDDTVFSVWENAMQIQYQLGKYQELAELSENAMDLFPNQGSSYYFYGMAIAKNDNHSEAISNYQLALMMSSKNPLLTADILQAMAVSQIEQQQYSSALETVQKGLKINPESAGLLEVYGDVLFADGDTAGAVEQWKKALKIRPTDKLKQKIAGLGN